MESAAAAATGAVTHRVLLGLFLLGAAGCGRVRTENLYRRAEQLSKQEDLQGALQSAEAGLRREPSWRFRLLKADILLSSGQAREAMSVLAAPEVSITPEQRARLAMYRGAAAYFVSDYAKAEAELDSARALAEPLASPLLDAEIGLRLSTVKVREGRLAEADAVLRNVLQIATAQHDEFLEANATGNLGFMLMNSSRYEEAIYWFERALPAFEKLHSRTRVTRTIGNLGWCYHRLGDENKALQLTRQAEEAFRAAGNRYEQQIWLGNMSDIFFSQENFAAAASAGKEALAIARGLGDKYWIGWWLSNLALVSIHLRDFDSAERYNNEALALFRENPGNQAGFYPQVNQANIAAGRNNFDDAETLFRAVVASSNDPVPILDAESGLIALLLEQQQTGRATAEFQRAIALIERSRAALNREDYQLTYLSSLIHFYQQYVDFLVAQGKPELALEAAEASRARVLEEKLHSGPAQATLSIAALKTFARAWHSVLLSYWLAPQRSFLWVITAGDVKLHILPGEKQIAGLVEAYRSYIENLHDPLRSEFPAGKELSGILLGEVQASRLIVVPDRALHSLNFETLPDPKDPAHYLLERATVEIAPSLGVLVEARKSARAERSLLMIGNPEPAVEEYPRLPYAAKEMQLIARDFPANRRVILEGPQAYPAAYRAASPAHFSWIHFAAHASANRESPLDSALILSRHDSTYSLAAREVMNIALNADLVTLSACRSAGSKTYSGEGLVGLAWAFLRAGARNVVAGLWDVTDMSTATLMSDFYDRLAANAAPADALREAKLALLHSAGAYKKPFYWGPFQLYAGGM